MKLHAKDLGDKCRYCDEENEKELTIDHIVPKSRGGTDELNNLQVLCKRCNLIKRSMTVEELREYCIRYIENYENRLIVTRKILQNL